MSRCSELAQRWVTDRIQTKGRTREQAFGELILITEENIKDLEERVQALRTALEDETEEYVQFRLEPLYVAVERETSLLAATREVEKSNWRS